MTSIQGEDLRETHGKLVGNPSRLLLGPVMMLTRCMGFQVSSIFSLTGFGKCPILGIGLKHHLQKYLLEMTY